MKPTDSTFRRWQVCTRYDIPDRADPTVTYLTRWRIVQTPWFGIYLHRIHLPDSDAHPHDHPWPFVSVVLKGGYDEDLVVGTVPLRDRRYPQFTRASRGFLSIARRRATDMHRIYRLYRRPTWTLVLVGRRCRTWGFHTPRHGWVRWTDYLGHAPGERT
jgi:hypothetical protein